MGELRDLIGIYGAVDWAVQADEGRRPPVSRLLPVYQTERVHWYDDFVEWTDERRENREDPAFPPLEDALRALADEPAIGRMRARRLFAIATVMRARPEMGERGSPLWDLAWRALHVEGLAGSEEEAVELLEILADDDLLPPVEDQSPEALEASWDSIAARVAPKIDVDDPESLGPRPCAGWLVEVELPGGKVPVAALTTVWETDRVRFDRAISFLEPSNWPHCCSFWCEMRRDAQVGDVFQYHEVVSTDCDHKALAWTLAADLEFTFRSDPGVAIANYRLNKAIPQPDVLVDEGSLMVERLGVDDMSPVRVTTSKRIKFGRSFSGEALAMIMCALGYASVVEDLVFTCAMLPEKKAPGTKFPGKAPAKAPGKAPLPGSGFKGIADEVAAAVKDCADECADALDASSKAIAENRYTADALVQDMARAWVRLLREGATAVDLGMRSARTAARPARDRTPDRKS